VAVLIPAAGSGARMGGLAKAFMILRGEPLLVHALRPFLARTDVRHAVVALPADHAAAPPPWLAELDPRVTIVAGGERRAESVRCALAALPDEVEIVIVHDAARPLITAAIVERTLAATGPRVGAIAAIPAIDTIQHVDADRRIVSTPEREALWQAQTPQAFPRALLAAAYERAARDGFVPTDEASLVVRYGGTVVVVEGARENMKITVPSDLLCADAVLGARGP
jgi:2-C-methyl-D-erythritol 4-phosphate cytidylyltransferase